MSQIAKTKTVDRTGVAIYAGPAMGNKYVMPKEYAVKTARPVAKGKSVATMGAEGSAVSAKASRRATTEPAWEMDAPQIALENNAGTMGVAENAASAPWG